MPGRRKKEDSPYRDAAATLAMNVRQTRVGRGWSQQRLAEQAAIAYGTVRAIEGGNVIEPGVFTICAIAEALGIQISELLQRTPEPSSD